jgi:hypothetical protein
MKYLIAFLLHFSCYACDNCDFIREKIKEKYDNKCHYYYSHNNGDYEFVRSHYDFAQIMAFQECLNLIDEILPKH